MENFINIIWPLVYSVDEKGWEIIDMKNSNLSRATVAIFVDRCDQHYVHLINPSFQTQLKTADGKDRLYELIEK